VPPAHEPLHGLVVAAYRRHYAVDLDEGGTLECVLKGRSTTLACGDRVTVERTHGGGAIVDVEPRRSLLFRSDAFREKLIAANVTQVLGVVASDVPVDEHLLNRWIIAAETQRCRFVLVVNKRDLPDADAFVARFAPYARRRSAEERIGLRRADDVVVGDAAGVVRRPGDDAAVVRHREVGMMILAIRDPRECVHEADRLVKVGEAIRLLEAPLRIRPAIEHGELRAKRVVGELARAGATVLRRELRDFGRRCGKCGGHRNLHRRSAALTMTR
jgi:hypothetical protein